VALSNAVMEATKCVSNSCPCAFVAGVSPTEPASCRQLEHTVADATWGRLSVTLSEPHSPFCLFSTWTITVWRWHSEVCKVIAYLAEIFGSLLLGLWLMPTVGCVPSVLEFRTSHYCPNGIMSTCTFLLLKIYYSLLLLLLLMVVFWLSVITTHLTK